MSTPQPHRHSPLPKGMSLDAAARIAAPFALLGDPSRLRIVYALVEGGALCVSDIATVADMSESATSHQLAKLRGAGVVRSERRGREIWYAVADAHVRVLLDVAAEHYLGGEAGDGRVARDGIADGAATEGAPV